MWLFLISLLFLLLQAPFSTFGIFLESKSDLKCYKSHQTVLIGDDFSKNATTVTHTRYGFCVNARMYNDTHQTSIKAFWEANKVPLECHYYGTHCWPLNRNNSDAACCCATDLCNENDDAISLIYPNSFYPSVWFRLLMMLRAFMFFVTTQTIPVWLTILGTIAFHRILTRFNREVPENDWEDPMDQTMTQQLDRVDSMDEYSDYSFKRTENSQRCKKKKGVSIMQNTPNVDSRPLLPPKTYSNRQLKMKSSRIKTAKPGAKKEVFGLDKTTEGSSPREEDTQPSERKIRSPIKGIQQEKPPSMIVLPNGRVQKVSMNFEEGDEEWDEQ